MTVAQPPGPGSERSLAARGGLARVGGFLVGQAVTVGAIALLFRHLGVVQSGRYVTVLSLVAIVGGLTDLGLTTLTVRELSGGADRALLGRSLGLRLASTVIGLVLVGVFVVLAGYPGVMVAGVGIVGAGLLAQNVGATLACELLVALRAGRVAAADLVRQVAAAVLLAGGVAAGFGLAGFFALLVPGALAGLVAIALGTRAVRPSLAGWRALLRATAPFAIAAAASVLFFRIALVELSLLGTARDTGLFAASFRVVEVLAVLPALAVSTAFPLFAAAVADGDRARLAAGVGRTLGICVAAGGALALALVLGAGVVIDVIAGSSFHGSIAVLRVQGIALLFSFVAAPWGFALLALGRERALMWINLAGLVIAGALAAVLIDAHGARGAALATVIGEAGLTVAFGVVLAREGLSLRPRGWRSAGR